MSKKTPEAAEIEPLMEDVEALLDATSHIAEEKVVAARERLATALNHGRGILEGVQEKAIASAKATDKAIREHPYQSLGIAVGVGAVLGFILSRRH